MAESRQIEADWGRNVAICMILVSEDHDYAKDIAGRTELVSSAVGYRT